MKKALSIVVASLAALALGVGPAFAGTFGDYNTINASGGTSLTDGLKVDIASAQLQVTRNGVGQLYSELALPDEDDADALSNYFTVAWTSGGTDYTLAPAGGGEVGYSADYDWESGTSTVSLTDSNRSGTVVNTLTSEVIGGGSDRIILEVTYKYTYPDQFVNISTALTLPTGWTNPTRVYWNTDSTLGGADEGNQFQGTLANGQAVRGVVSPDGAQIEAFRQVAGQSVKSWAADYRCAWDLYDDCTNSGWVYANEDAPDAIATGTNVDNGFGISTPVVSTSGEHTASFDLLFVSCLDGVEALQCVNDSLGLTLAETGVDASGIALGGLALVGLGAVVAIRRRARA